MSYAPRLALSMLLTGVAASCGAAETSVQLHGFSDVVHRGASLTDGRGAIGATVTVDAASGLFAGLSTHYGQGTPNGRHLLRYAGLHAGWFKPLAGGRAIEFSLSRHVFGDVADWRYDELRVDYHFSEQFTLTAAVSDDYYGRGSEVVLSEVTWQRELGGGVFTRIVAGGGWLPDADDRSISWGTLGVGVARGRISTELSFNATAADLIPAPGADGSALALRVSYLLR
ncbi:MAG: hypothetical protein AAGM16_00395 [Pseudomonadota bacterium]